MHLLLPNASNGYGLRHSRGGMLFGKTVSEVPGGATAAQCAAPFAGARGPNCQARAAMMHANEACALLRGGWWLRPHSLKRRLGSHALGAGRKVVRRTRVIHTRGCLDLCPEASCSQALRRCVASTGPQRRRIFCNPGRFEGMEGWGVRGGDTGTPGIPTCRCLTAITPPCRSPQTGKKTDAALLLAWRRLNRGCHWTPCPVRF